MLTEKSMYRISLCHYPPLDVLLFAHPWGAFYTISLSLSQACCTALLPGHARFQCSSPSCIPCPLVAIRQKCYKAGRTPPSKTALLTRIHCIAQPGNHTEASLCPVDVSAVCVWLNEHVHVLFVPLLAVSVRVGTCMCVRLCEPQWQTLTALPWVHLWLTCSYCTDCYITSTLYQDKWWAV